jgi:hypothetical protein
VHSILQGDSSVAPEGTIQQKKKREGELLLQTKADFGPRPTSEKESRHFPVHFASSILKNCLKQVYDIVI